jgi:hypothetical protein
MSEAKQSQSRIFFEKKDEAFINKENLKPKSYRGYGDLLAVERFN